jgi:competence protein ComGB
MVFILSGYLFIYRVNPLHRYRLLLHIPFLSHYLQLYLTQYLAFHLGSLIRSGLTVNQSLLIIKDRTKPLFFHLEADDLYKQLKEGKTLAELFRTRPYYLKEFNQVIYQGELNGMLGPALFDYASRLLKRMESQLTAALNSVQPVILVIMGSLTLVLFLSIMLPVFNIINGL